MKKIKNVIGDDTILSLKGSIWDEEDDKSFWLILGVFCWFYLILGSCSLF